MKPGEALLRQMPVALAALCVLLAAAAASLRWEALQAARGSPGDLTHLQARAATSSPSVAATRDFSALLSPWPSDSQALLAQIQQSAQPLNVAVTSFASSTKPATTSTLGVGDLSLTLRGPYAGIKQVLSDLLDRTPSAVLEHLTLRKSQFPNDLEAQVRIRLLSRPLP